VVLEEQLVGFLNALTDILHCLRADLLPEGFTLSEFGNMSLKLRAIQMLAPHPVVPFVQGDAMVINHPGRIDRPLEVLISTALIELKLQCLHVSMIAYCIQDDSMKTITLRCSDEEYEKLSKHCKKKERSLNEVLRELIRSLDSAD
jgi:Ribbon-helix-helix protein, copG family